MAEKVYNTSAKLVYCITYFIGLISNNTFWYLVSVKSLTGVILIFRTHEWKIYFLQTEVISFTFKISLLFVWVLFDFNITLNRNLLIVVHVQSLKYFGQQFFQIEWIGVTFGLGWTLWSLSQPGLYSSYLCKASWKVNYWLAVSCYCQCVFIYTERNLIMKDKCVSFFQSLLAVFYRIKLIYYIF